MKSDGRPRVLLVEDEEAIRELLSFHLTLADYEFVTISDGNEALQLTQQEPFDLIVLDIVLPGVDGITICQSIRHGGPNQEVPILMLTARGDESDRVVGLESGADDYLTKPFGRSRAVRAIEGAVEKTQEHLAQFNQHSASRGRCSSRCHVGSDTTARDSR